MNVIIIIGNLGKDPELKQSSGGKDYCNFSVGVKGFGDKPTNWFNCTAFGKTAELISQYSKKGDKIGLSGSIEFDEYEKDGVKVKTTKLIVSAVTFCTSGKAPSQEVKAASPRAKSQAIDEYDPFADE